MTRLQSKQSRVLRRRLTVQTLIAWVVYTITFIALAIAANAYLVPWIADEVVSYTSEIRNFETEDYLEHNTFSQLFNDYVDSMSEEKIEIVSISDNTAFLDARVLQELVTNDGIPDAIISNLINESIIAYESESDFSNTSDLVFDFALTSEIDLTTIDPSLFLDWAVAYPDKVAAIMHDCNSSDIEKARISVLGEKWRTVDIGEINTIESDTDGNTISNYNIKITPQFLAREAALQDLNNLQKLDANGEWEISTNTGSDDGNDVLIARELSAYHWLKSFKIPLAILLYLFGCLILAIVEMRRSLRYFDKLSEAVATLIANRDKPVELPPSLSITESELNRIRLEALADERTAAAAEQRKNELVAYLAHDIRTPLTSVIGYLSLMNESPDLPDKTRQRFTATAYAKAEQLETLINEFFEITRYNLQSIPIERSNINVRLFLEQIAEEFYPTASEKSVNIAIDAPANQIFFVDPEKLARAIGNVMRNAVAYADANSEVRISASCEEDESHTKSWCIIISDHGQEISPAHLESIFEKFYREDRARGTKSGGAGLGLAIAKEIITAHGGTIFAESHEGLTSFTIAIPA